MQKCSFYRGWQDTKAGTVSDDRFFPSEIRPVSTPLAEGIIPASHLTHSYLQFKLHRNSKSGHLIGCDRTPSLIRAVFEMAIR